MSVTVFVMGFCHAVLQKNVENADTTNTDVLQKIGVKEITSARNNYDKLPEN